MRIGIDIDGVVSDSYTVWLRELNRRFGKNITIVTDYDLHVDFQVPREEMNQFFMENTERLLMLPELVEGAKEGVESLLQEGHDLIFVTARSPEEENFTVRWLTMRGIPHKHIIFTGFKSKVDVIKQWGIEIFIEDYQVNAEAIAQCGIPVFLLNTSYNQAELSEGIIRCHSWSEIVQGIHKLDSYQAHLPQSGITDE